MFQTEKRKRKEKATILKSSPLKVCFVWDKNSCAEMSAYFTLTGMHHITANRNLGIWEFYHLASMIKKWKSKRKFKWEVSDTDPSSLISWSRALNILHCDRAGCHGIGRKGATHLSRPEAGKMASSEILIRLHGRHGVLGTVQKGEDNLLRIHNEGSGQWNSHPSKYQACATRSKPCLQTQTWEGQADKGGGAH